MEDIPEVKQEPITIILNNREEIRALNQRIKYLKDKCVELEENLKRSAIVR